MVRLSRLSILKPSVITSFNKEGFVLVGARIPMSSTAVSKALCSTNSCWCFKALARAYQPGGRSLASITLTRFNRCARFAPKYSVAPLLSFLSLTSLFPN